MIVTASAPGKLVLLGEYAVLNGSPALVAAVDRRARVRLEPGGDTTMITAPSLGLERSPLVTSDERLGLAAACLGEFRGHVEIDTADFYEGGHKLGLGSSAAVCVALCAAVAGNTDVFEDARTIHRRVQGGGSGIDVAASALGGVLRYQTRAESPSLAASLPEGIPKGIPKGIEVVVVWTGRSTSTAEMVKRVIGSGASLDDLAEATAAGLDARDAASFLDAVRAFFDGLRVLERAAGVNIVTGPHEQIASLVEGPQVAYKPSGAGGGDVGLVFCRTDAVAAVRERLAAYVLPPIQLGAPGVQL